MKKLETIFLIFFVLVSFKIFISKHEEEKFTLNKSKKCNDLNYDNHDLNRVENLSEFKIDLMIEDERKWKKIILNTQYQNLKIKVLLGTNLLVQN